VRDQLDAVADKLAPGFNPGRHRQATAGCVAGQHHG
jgi:hypothetical protein